ncbi:MAG: glycosyltransferase, partial [Rhodothermales bacterium]
MPTDVHRPLWSVMIPTYNCARYLRETLKSVMAQDPGPDRMQIEVVDDHSTLDDPEVVVAEWAGRVAFVRQPENVGHTENFSTCLRRARGELIHLLHGDDVVLTGFYRQMERAFQQNGRIGAAFCRHIFIDGEGRWKGISPLEQRATGELENGLERLASEQRVVTPSMVVKRDVYEALGGFDDRLICSEDWEMWVRVAAHYPVWYEIEPLAMYRMHDASNTGRHIRSGEDITFTYRAIEMFIPYLPDSMASRVGRAAKITYAHAALRMARQVYAAGDAAAAGAQIRAALACSRSWTVLAHVGRLLSWAVWRRLSGKR